MYESIQDAMPFVFGAMSFLAIMMFLENKEIL